MANEINQPEKKAAEDAKRLDKWKGRIEYGRMSRDEFGNTDDRWRKYTKGMAGDFGSEDLLGDEAIDVNMVHSTVKTMLPPLYTAEPWISAKPRNAKILIGGKEYDNIERAKFNEAEINYWLKELEVRTAVIKPCVHDCEATNHGFAFVGWQTKSKEFEPNPRRHGSRPFITRLSPTQVLVPHGTKEDIEDAEWMAIGWIRALQDVKKAYGTAADDLKGTVTLEAPTGSKPSGIAKKWLDSDDARLVQIWQIYDKRDKMIRTFAEGHDKWLEEGAWKDWTGEFPVVNLSFVSVPDEFWGTPPMQYYWPQQMELNAARTASRRRNNRLKNVVWMSKDLETDLEQAYIDAEDGGIISVPTHGEDIRKFILIDHGLSAPNEQYANGSVQMNDLFTISGLGPQQRTGGDPAVGTATESANVEKWAMVRATDRGDAVRTFYLNLIRKLWMILQMHPNEKRKYLIHGPKAGLYKTISFTLKELQAEIDFEMDLGTVMSDNPNRREQTSLARYNLMRQDPEVEPKSLLVDVFESQGCPDPERYLVELRDPDEEFQLITQSIPVEADIRDDHISHMKEHQAQESAIDQMLDQVDGQQGEEADATRMQISSAGALLLAHKNHHGMFIEQITGKPFNQQQGEPGQPVAENVLRQEQAQLGRGGAETAAEVAGQPMVSPEGVQTGV